MPHLAAARLTVALAVAATLAPLAPSAHAQLAYEIPPDNPFAGVAGARGEVYAYGLRNPFRWSFDRVTGDMYVGDVGGSQREEVTFVPRAQSAAANFGWSCFEGDVAGPAACTPANHRAPQHTYAETGDPVVGGYVARHSSLGALQGQYLFARYGTGQIYSLGAGATGTATPTNLVVTQLTSFGEEAAEAQCARHSACLARNPVCWLPVPLGWR